MKCCGINGPLDWTNATLPIPPACCNQPINSESCTVPLYNKGCKPALKEFVQSNVTLIAGIGIGLGVFQVSKLFGEKQLQSNPFDEHMLIDLLIFLCSYSAAGHCILMLLVFSIPSRSLLLIY